MAGWVKRAPEDTRNAANGPDRRCGPAASADLSEALRALASTVERLRQELRLHEESVESRLDDLAAALLPETSGRGDAGAPRTQLALRRHESCTSGPAPAGRSSGQRAASRCCTTVVAFCLQPFQVYVNHSPVRSWHGNRSQEILRFLLTRYPSPVSRDVLIETFWPTVDPAAARRNLHQAMYRLRETLRAVPGGEDVICFEQARYRLDREAQVWTDADEFERLAVQANRALAAGDVETAIGDLAAAETLYEDDYMHEFPYDDWCRDRREFLHRLYVDVVTCLADHYSAQGNHAASIALCQRLLARDPTQEAAYRMLMQSYLSKGNHHLAAAAFRQCQAALRTELDLEPCRETTRISEQIGT